MHICFECMFHMFHLSKTYVANVCSKCFSCFRLIFHVFHLDVTMTIQVCFICLQVCCNGQTDVVEEMRR
jgi:hypothetical protein